MRDARSIAGFTALSSTTEEVEFGVVRSATARGFSAAGNTQGHGPSSGLIQTPHAHLRAGHDHLERIWRCRTVIGVGTATGATREGAIQERFGRRQCPAVGTARAHLQDDNVARARGPPSFTRRPVFIVVIVIIIVAWCAAACVAPASRSHTRGPGAVGCACTVAGLA